MQKRKYVLIMILVGLLMIVLPMTYFYVKHQELLAQRNHLLCEVLKPGMSVDEVLETLHKVGEFRVNKGEWSGGYIQLAVSFTDPNDRELYGSFDLGFFDSKYKSAYIRGFDFLDNICDFSQLPQSATATPNP